MSDEVTPAMVSEFDQCWAQSEQFLFQLAHTYASARRLDAANGIPECVSIVSLTRALLDDLPIDGMSSALAVAIVSMARRMAAP